MTTKSTNILKIKTLFVALLLSGAQATLAATDNASIFIRYQYDSKDIVSMLEQANGKTLSPNSTAARWLDEMGWRRWVKEAEGKSFQFTSEMRAQLLAQDKLLSESFAYREGDAIWVPTEQGEKPYGFQNANVNARGQITKILKGDSATYFVVELGVDNGGQGGMQTIQGKYYDGHVGPVLDYGPNYKIEKKTYIYSMEEIERYNAPFRSALVSSDTGIQVDYVRDAKWIEKINRFKDQVIADKLEVDFTKTPSQIYAAQQRLIKAIFNFFKMNRNAPGGSPLLGDMAAGGGTCFTQACVLSHAVHAVGEPYGLRAINIKGSTVNPMGGHGFVRLMLRGVEETHVFDAKLDASGRALPGQGIQITSEAINYISDPGWADYGATPDYFSMMPIERSINPIPINANRAVHDVIQGDSFDKVVAGHGNKGAFVSQIEFRDDMFRGAKSAEFLNPRGQISEAATLERSLGSDMASMTNEAKALKSSAENARALKTRILTNIVERRAASLTLPGMNAENLKVLLTEYLFRAVK